MDRPDEEPAADGSADDEGPSLSSQQARELAALLIAEGASQDTWVAEVVRALSGKRPDAADPGETSEPAGQDCDTPGVPPPADETDSG